MVNTFTTGQLEKLSGISATRLIRWDNERVLRANGLRDRGRLLDRAYTHEQALGVLALGELNRGGLRDRDLRKVAKALPESISSCVYLVYVCGRLCPRSTVEEVCGLLELESGRIIIVRKLTARLFGLRLVA